MELAGLKNPCVPSWSDDAVGTEAPCFGVRFWEAPQKKAPPCAGLFLWL